MRDDEIIHILADSGDPRESLVLMVLFQVYQDLVEDFIG